MDKNNFAKNFIPTDPALVNKERLLGNKTEQKKSQLELLEKLKPTKILNEEISKEVEKIFVKANLNVPKQTVDIEIKNKEKLTEETIIEKIKVSEPLVVVDGKISIDQSKLVDLIGKQNSVVIQNTLEKVRQSTADRIASSGGGGVSVKYQDFSGNKVSLLKSVNDLIFTGDGVTLEREGKNIVVDIPGVSVVAGDPTIDFARESTMLQLYANMQTMLSLVNNLQGLIIPQVYPNGIGGSTSSWTPI